MTQIKNNFFFTLNKFSNLSEREDGLREFSSDSKLLTVSVVTQPHCQLHPPLLLMTPHASVVRNRKNAQIKK